MRILMVNKFARVTGGADRYALELTAALRARGHEIIWLSTAAEGNTERRGAFVPCTVTSSSTSTVSAREAARVARLAVWNRQAASAAERLLRDTRPHVVHAHKLYPQLSAAPVVAAARLGVPVVQTLHDYELISASWPDHTGTPVATVGNATRRILDTATFPPRRWAHLPRVDAFIANSRFLAATYERFGVRSTVAPNAVARSDVEETPFDRRSGVVFVGRLSEEKGLEDVIEVARRCPHLDVRVAGDGPRADLIETALSALPNLTLLGWLPPERLPTLVAGARVAIVPSQWEEPSGLAALEAFAVGTPVVSYRRGGLADAVRESGGGRVVEGGPDELALTCSEIAGDRHLWEGLSSAARESVETRFSSERWVATVESVYESVAGARIKGP